MMLLVIVFQLEPERKSSKINTTFRKYSASYKRTECEASKFNANFTFAQFGTAGKYLRYVKCKIVETVLFNPEWTQAAS